jgi:hypothetical protein
MPLAPGAQPLLRHYWRGPDISGAFLFKFDRGVDDAGMIIGPLSSGISLRLLKFITKYRYRIKWVPFPYNK